MHTQSNMRMREKWAMGMAVKRGMKVMRGLGTKN